MERKGLLIDLDYCVGCHACTVACKQELDLDADTWGIKVTEFNYKGNNDRVQVDYLPFPTVLCNLCGERITSGEDDKPSCVKHCMTKCISYGTVSKLINDMSKMSRPVIYIKN